jgi:hypothetical protein
MEMNYFTEPATEAQKIIVANGYELKTEPREQYSYESRVVQEVSTEHYVAIVREYGSIDTDQQLILVNIADRVCAKLVHHPVSTPSCHWGCIEIQSLEEKSDGVLVKYTINGEPFEGTYSLTAKAEVLQKTRPVLAKIS